MRTLTIKTSQDGYIDTLEFRTIDASHLEMTINGYTSAFSVLHVQQLNEQYRDEVTKWNRYNYFNSKEIEKYAGWVTKWSTFRPDIVAHYKKEIERLESELDEMADAIKNTVYTV